MKVEVRCPNGHRFRCDHQHLGRTVKCPKIGCHARFVLDAIDEAADRKSTTYDLEPELPETPHQATDIRETPAFNELLYEHRAKIGESAKPAPESTAKSVSLAETIIVGIILIAAAVGLGFLPSLIPSHWNLPGPVTWCLSYLWTPLCYIVAGFFLLGLIAAVLGGGKDPILRAESGQVHPTRDSASPATAGTTHPASTATDVETNVTEAALAELKKLNDPKRNWAPNLWVFLLSLLAFFFLGLLRFEPVTVTVLLVLIFLHELGHLLAMRVFGYKELKMFFIPLLGGLASGTKSQTKGWQEVIVALAGPLPGMVLGFVLLVFSLGESPGWVWTAAWWFVFLNWFNLLPVFPLDGGHVLNELIFCRSRHLETAFKVLAAGALIAGGLFLGSYVLGIFGLLMLLCVPSGVRIQSTVAELRKRVPDDMYGPIARLPDAVLRHLIDSVRARSIVASDAKTLASEVNQIWMRLNVRQPGWLATVGFLAVYLCSLASIAVVPLVLLALVLLNVVPEPRGEWFDNVTERLAESAEERLREESPLHAAIFDCDVEALESMRIDPFMLSDSDIFDRTALYFAARQSCPQAIERLLEAGAHLELQTWRGTTALIEAAYQDCTECILLLLDAGADVNRTDHSGHTALMRAASKGNLQSVELLLERGADRSLLCEAGDSAFDHASTYAEESEHLQTILSLLEPD